MEFTGLALEMTQNEEKFCSAMRLLFARIEKLKKCYSSKEWNFLVALADMNQPCILYIEVPSGRMGRVGIRLDDDLHLSEIADAVFDAVKDSIDRRKAERNEVLEVL